MNAKFLLAGLLAAGFTFMTTAAQAKEMIAYVNLQRAILEVEEGKRAKSKLKKEFDKRQKALTVKEEELKRLKDALDKNSVVKDDAATRQQKLEFQNKLLELQQEFVKEQQELAKLEQKHLSKITVKMRKVIKTIGKTGGYSLILEIQDSRLLYAKAHLDLTNELIRKYNSTHK